jgi:hypothetical protein
LTKWHLDKMASRQNGKSMRWQVYLKASCQNNMLVGIMTSWWDGKLTKWHVKSTLMKWQVDKMAGWQNEQVDLKASWQNDTLMK